MDPTFSLPLRSSPWTLKTGDQPGLCLLLEMVCQELQLETLFLTMVLQENTRWLRAHIWSLSRKINKCKTSFDGDN